MAGTVHNYSTPLIKTLRHDLLVLLLYKEVEKLWHFLNLSDIDYDDTNLREKSGTLWELIYLIPMLWAETFAVCYMVLVQFCFI